MTITALYNDRSEHVADVISINLHSYEIKGVENTSLAHVYRRVGFVELQQFKSSFDLITQKEFEDHQTNMFEYLEG